MKSLAYKSILLSAIVGLVFICGCVQEPLKPKEEHSGLKQEKLSFVEHYSLAPMNITLDASQYDLPLKTEAIYNFDEFSTKIPLDDDALRMFEENGFVVIRNSFNNEEESITRPYKTLKRLDIPIIITADSLLHLYHIQFDETLRQIEEREFYDTIWTMSMELLNESIEDYNSYNGELKEASRRNVAYFAVGLSLLEPSEDQLCLEDWKCRDPGFASAYFNITDLARFRFEVPDFVKSEVEAELSLIEKHESVSASPIFYYKEDYSQYVPRGHYTRSEKLKNYFNAFMWYGRMSYILKGGCPDCLVSDRDAKLQTMGASLIASVFAERESERDKWDRIYRVTAFYIGLSDDLGPYEYITALDSVFHGEFEPEELTVENIAKLKSKLAEYSAPDIYGGTGDCDIPPPFTPEQADQCLVNTKGFRLLGQRFIPDSYIFSHLVGVYTGIYQGDGERKPFTTVSSDAGIELRGFPRGLDLMALLGSDRARELLDELDDSNYTSYDDAYRSLESEFNAFNETEWNRNLYWSWLYTLKPLLNVFGHGYPTFMQTEAWQEKELNTALASWTELRHDTILYAKQSYTMQVTAIQVPSVEEPVVGYVEPLPDFYNRLLALTRMTNSGLTSMNVLDNESSNSLDDLETILERLVELSAKELANEELTEADYEFIDDFGSELNAVISEVDDKAKKTTIIADVHTDGNTGLVLEEGVGYVDLIVIAYKVPDGRILIGAGPVMTYYEFKQPLQDRLTDEKWREMLRSEPPERPEWYSDITSTNCSVHRHVAVSFI